MFNKKIKNVADLESALKSVYDRAEDGVAQDFMEKVSMDVMGKQIDEKDSRNHPVKGCMECPFVTSVPILDKRKAPIPHSYCRWDGGKSDISSYIETENVAPTDCPLVTQDIKVTLSKN